MYCTRRELTTGQAGSSSRKRRAGVAGGARGCSLLRRAWLRVPLATRPRALPATTARAHSVLGAHRDVCSSPRRLPEKEIQRRRGRVRLPGDDEATARLRGDLKPGPRRDQPGRPASLISRGKHNRTYRKGPVFGRPRSSTPPSVPDPSPPDPDTGTLRPARVTEMTTVQNRRPQSGRRRSGERGAAGAGSSPLSSNPLRKPGESRLSQVRHLQSGQNK